MESFLIWQHSSQTSGSAHLQSDSTKKTLFEALFESGMRVLCRLNSKQFMENILFATTQQIERKLSALLYVMGILATILIRKIYGVAVMV